MPDQSSPQRHSVIREERTPTDLDTLIPGYRLCARTEGKSYNTISLNVTALRLFQEFLRAVQIPTDVDYIGVPEIRQFILYLQQVKAWRRHPTISPRSHGLSGHSINSYLRAISAFWSWLVAEEITTDNPFRRIKIPRPPRKVVPTFTEAHIRSLLNVIDKSTSLGMRDRAVVLTLLDTGLRVSELTTLELEHVDLEAGMLKVFGKGAKERLAPIGARVQRALWKYINQFRPEPALRTNSLFLTRNGVPLTKVYVETLLKRYAKKAGIDGVRCSPHTFRHTFAITYLRNGGDVFSLQQILGHSSLDAVRVYVNLAQSDVKAAHRRYSPADNMNLGTR
jgi:site-specific recombinase XerD